MARFPLVPNISPMPVGKSIGRADNTHALRVVRAGLLVVLLVVLLGVGLGMRSPVTHAAAAATACTPQLITSKSHSAPLLQGTVTAKLYASYDATGKFCRAWSNATVHLIAFAPPGGLVAGLNTSCGGGNDPAGGAIHVDGGGNKGMTFTVNSANSTAHCAYAYAQFFFDGTGSVTVPTDPRTFGG